MANTFKFISYKKDCRLVIGNVKSLAQEMLSGFEGDRGRRQFLNEFLLNSLLFAGLNDYQTKTSVTIKMNSDEKVSCLIGEQHFRFEYSPQFERQMGYPDMQRHFGTTLSITVGDFSGLHTSTVMANEASVSENFNFFTRQSEQLPTEFIVKEGDATIGVVIQPLPFAKLDELSKLRETVVKEIQGINQQNWQETPALFKNVGKLLWGKEVV